MNIKRIITILSLFLLLSCGYQPLHSKKQIKKNYNFSINNINFSGENEINQDLKNKLKEYLNNKNKEINLNLNLNSIIKKTIASKDKKGDPKTFSMNIIINLEIFKDQIVKNKKNFKGSFEYSNRVNKFGLKQYEKDIKNNLTTKLSNDIIKYLNLIK